MVTGAAGCADEAEEDVPVHLAALRATDPVLGPAAGGEHERARNRVIGLWNGSLEQLLLFCDLAVWQHGQCVFLALDGPSGFSRRSATRGLRH